MFDRLSQSIRGGGLVAATTIGAGIFVLPYVFLRGGWLVGILYFLILGFLVVFAHHLFSEVFSKAGDKRGLLGLIRDNFGGGFFYFATIVFKGGLFLTLVIYLLLGSSFMTMVFPGVNHGVALAWFWVIASFPILLSLRRFVGLEVGATLLMALIVAFVFAKGLPIDIERVGPPVGDWFFPFGHVLFALAGWTAVYPLYEISKKRKSLIYPLIFGTGVSIAIYLFFVLGITSGAPNITPDAISGLTDWPNWQIDLLAVLGLFAIWTSYGPIGLEIRSSFEKDLRVSRIVSFLAVLFVPLILIWLGFNNFLEMVGLVGGVFLAFQYLLIVLVSRKVLALRGFRRVVSALVILIFALAVVYEIYYFVIK
ncbi:MAG: amino acid transporter aATP11 [Parcubacteria group bacterium Gr01-1014_20]|nr:MAG: amino acid transporter aATP11 [Parcubacteria group bacterium Gr01-1014_20]